MLKKLPSEVQNFIDKWFELEIDTKKIPAPYFINIGGFLKKPVLAGKGTIEEIQNTTEEMIKGKDLNAQEILDFMHENGIGIDCSGLVYQIYDFWIQSKEKGRLQDFLPQVPFYKLRKFLSRKTKPQNSIGADEFTSEPFSQKIDLKDIEPGDLIRTKSGKHVLFVTEVETHENENPKRIKFVQSARLYNRDGIRYGEIFLNEDKSLNTAKWEDYDKNEPVNHSFEGWREGINTNGVFRPKFLDEVKNPK